MHVAQAKYIRTNTISLFLFFLLLFPFISLFSISLSLSPSLSLTHSLVAFFSFSVLRHFKAQMKTLLRAKEQYNKKSQIMPKKYSQIVFLINRDVWRGVKWHSILMLIFTCWILYKHLFGGTVWHGWIHAFSRIFSHFLNWHCEKKSTAQSELDTWKASRQNSPNMEKQHKSLVICKRSFTIFAIHTFKWKISTCSFVLKIQQQKLLVYQMRK